MTKKKENTPFVDLSGVWVVENVFHDSPVYMNLIHDGTSGCYKSDTAFYGVWRCTAYSYANDEVKFVFHGGWQDYVYRGKLENGKSLVIGDKSIHR